VERFSPATRAWFRTRLGEPTAIQRAGWKPIASGANALLLAPTGSGKTLAAFLWSIDRLIRNPPTETGVRVLYVSPLKALAYDVDRNLRAPIDGIVAAAAEQGLTVRTPTIAIRTGDTSARERRRQLNHPGEILVTTPESLYLLLGSSARETLRTVETIIVDEAHALAPSKRGAHLALSLERLAALCERDPQRIGLSATARPAEAVAGYLGGDRSVEIVDTSAAPNIDLQVIVPVADMTRPDESLPPSTAAGRDDQRGLWPAIQPQILELIRSHRTTIVFVNSRGLCERLCHRLNELAGEELARAHHGSLAQAERKHIEEQLKAGAISAIVATSSLELGIDMGSVDLVVLVESPGSVASGLQRVGRSGHGVGERSKGRLFPKHRGDLLEATVVAARMSAGAIEALSIPTGALDVLAQQIVAMVATEEIDVAELRNLVRRAAGYHQLPDEAFDAVLDMLSGRYPSTAFAELRPRLNWDRQADRLTPRPGAKMLSLVNGGTIPDRGLYGVFLGHGGPRVGELDEEMVHETQPGQTFTLGASTWRVEDITRDQVIVSPAPGEPGKLPFWRGDGPGRPIELGRAIGEMTRRLTGMSPEQARALLAQELHADSWAADNVLAYLDEQREATGTVPTDRSITIERFRDEVGDWRVCILTPFGARVHAPWALALEARLSARAGHEVQSMWSDDGIALRFADADELPGDELFVPDPDEVEDLVVEQLGHSPLFSGSFRENAARALLLPRRRPDARMPLWLQRLKSQELLAVARRYPSFPILIETYRSCLRDSFDLPALVELLASVRSGEIQVESAQTTQASPFSRSLVFAYVNAYLYEGDAPLAERRAQALALDRQLLRELLGTEELRELLDQGAIDAVGGELQCLTPERRAHHPDAVHDLLRRLGDLSAAEARARIDGDADGWLAALRDDGRAVLVRIAGEDRWIACEDAALYQGLGVPLPAGIPAALLAPRDDALAEIVLRFASTRGPFREGEIERRYLLDAARVDECLRLLESQGALTHGAVSPARTEDEWCSTDVLRRIKRRTLTKLRDEVAAVDAATVARFLPQWHGIGVKRAGVQRLREVISQLEGLALPFQELERVILPARVADFHPAMLDELGATGYLVWIGAGALGARDGRITLYRRDRVPLLRAPGASAEALSPVAERLLVHLRERGAAFFAALVDAADASHDQVKEALWELVWAGLVSNDTFQPLRARAAGPVRSTSASRRRPSRTRLAASAGRWSTVEELVGSQVTPTERAHAFAHKLLERHGVVTRETSKLEELPGGFASVYPVLRAMEEAGQARRGYFIDGAGGAQFAAPGAVDRLRSARKSAGEAQVLAAVDPANPYGWLVAWPPSTSPPRRAPGAAVILCGGEPVLFLERGGRRLLSFPAAVDGSVLRQAIGALAVIAGRRRGKYLRIETIDDVPARTCSLASALIDGGFFADPRGLVLEAR